MSSPYNEIGKEVILLAKAHVTKVHETSTGLNDRVSVNGTVMTNNQAYRRAKQGKIEGFNGSISANGNKYIRSNPDKSKTNNIEK